MNPMWTIENGSHGTAQYHRYRPAFDGAVNVTAVLLGVLADPPGTIAFAFSVGEVNVWGVGS
jgi:hypothetical protein